MDKFLESKMMPIASKIGSNKVLTSIRDGIALAMPLIIIGALLLTINNLAIDPWLDFLEKTGISEYLNIGINGTFGLMGLITSFGVAYSLGNQHKVDGVSAGLLSLASFILVTPSISTGGKEPQEGIPLALMGSQGLFVAIVVGIFTALIFQWFINRDIQIKMPDTVPPAVSRSFSAIIPGFVIIALWIIVFVILKEFNIGNIHEILSKVLGVPLGIMGGTLIGTIILVGLNSALWFIGIHGQNIINSVMLPTWLKNLGENTAAYQKDHSADLPHIVTQPFMENFVYIGGGGATLGLVIVIAIMALKKGSSKQTKVISPLTLTPGLFNINEPAMFGLPIVLNIRLIAPFIMAPMINAIISYYAMAFGFVHLTMNLPAWTTPPVISGFLSTNHISGSILQVVLIIIDMLLYYPFYKAMDKYNAQLEQESETSNNVSD
ncbi:PTS sugar transporter subunit IIC [Mammaliicoccus lentus]|uniref:PTS sugar transporter subunit IIC n=1 Tax=Mammaliicoccus lentus TaxID=42858 RepID=UPI002DB859F6|nr:PTS sugar transporter subunit IIC [Mammaliicoccus lentus]MEB8090987.1 PTS sugar transporter subunit IIC [Mammaliicoccus lentus]